MRFRRAPALGRQGELERARSHRQDRAGRLDENRFPGELIGRTDGLRADDVVIIVQRGVGGGSSSGALGKCQEDGSESLSHQPVADRTSWIGRILRPPPERRIHPAALVRFADLPDESGVPIGMAACLGGGVGMRPAGSESVLQAGIEELGLVILVPAVSNVLGVGIPVLQ